MDQRKRFKEEVQGAIFLHGDSPDTIEAYLREKKWLHSEERILGMEKPGEGNMNFVIRIKTNQRNFILKQARPWVEKYPQIDAPINRILVEAQFYQLIQTDPFFEGFTPKILHFEAENFTIVLEDLGLGADYTSLYQKGQSIADQELTLLMQFLSKLHKHPFSKDQITQFPLNQDLKKLNHEHIFYFPYLLDNGFDLDNVQAGLQEISLAYKENEALKKKIEVLGKVYLGTGSTLLHGDYYPGSWLNVQGSPKVIDPEFAYFGRAEFDLGVVHAHLLMAQSSASKIELALAHYEKDESFDDGLFQAFTGVEILRRIIGLAQLPLELTLDEKATLLSNAAQMI